MYHWHNMGRRVLNLEYTSSKEPYREWIGYSLIRRRAAVPILAATAPIGPIGITDGASER